MKFKNRRLITAGVDLKVNPLLRVYMWHLIDELPEPKDYLQVFTCTERDGKQKLIHAQEEPEYRREYLICSDAPIFVGKIFVIDDDDYPYCYDCYNKFDAHPIKSYNYKPEPIFYGSGPLFMGVELEIDKGGERSDNAEFILHEANKDEYTLYAKHDGSISDGFELVSHPMSLEYHLNTMNWCGVFAEALDLGYRSHQTSTCGLHIHVNRFAFGNTYEEQEDAIGRVVFFVESHWNELLKFSRRTEENINRWASRYGISTTAKDTYKNAKDNRRGDRGKLCLHNS